MRNFRGEELARALPQDWRFRDHTKFGGWAYVSPDNQPSLYIFRGGIVKVTKGRFVDVQSQEFLAQNEISKIEFKTPTQEDDFHFQVKFKFNEGELSLTDRKGHYSGVLTRNRITGLFRRREEEITRAEIIIPKNPSVS